MKIIAITGANGFIGQAMVDHFASRGWQVRALSRHTHQLPTSKHITYHAYELDSKIDPELLKDVDYLVHTAYIKHDRLHPNALQLNQEGTARLLVSARNHHVKRTVFISSLSARTDAISDYGRQKYAIEQLFNTPADAIIRPGLVVGNGGLVKEMATFMHTKHIVPLIDGGSQPVQIIALDELVTAIEHILTKNISGTFTLASRQAYQYKDFYRTVAQHTGAKVVFVPLSFTLALGIIRTANLLHMPLAITEDNLWGLKQMARLKTADDLKKLDLTIRPLKATLAKTRLIP